MLPELPRSERVRPVHIVANDTLVESPLVVAHIKTTMTRFREAATALRLPLDVEITAPRQIWAEDIATNAERAAGRCRIRPVEI
ncbi:hypothetical protein [Benzoatithermus flavus]|uniref:Uncharacterized protein n=1 Tax=Benzoatithermus flavus TaxID=3108223 RepID=A0ABU8XN98_9PROT